MRFSEIRSNSKVTYLTLPHLFHVLPHDLQGVAGTVVGGHRVGAVPQDRQGDGLRAAGVPEPVLHPVS